MTNPMTDALATLNIDTDITRVDVSAVAVLARSEVEAQLDAAHKYPRSVGKFMKEATTLATLTQEIAESCIYSLPRGGKAIRGPSVRLAEIVSSAYGNLHVAARVVGTEDKEVISQGVAWDLEKNLRVTVESRRRITNKKNERYDDDMITVTGNAAASIALRNAVFRVVPRAYVDLIYSKIREVAVGNAETLADKRARLLERLGKMGVTPDRVLARVAKVSVEDIGLDEVETLIGLGTAVKNGDATIDEAFPSPSKPASDTKDLETKLREGGKKKEKAPPATAKTPSVPPPAKAAEVLAGNEMPPGWGGEKPEPCCYCGEPVTSADGVQFESPDGEVLTKHRNCTAFGKGVES